MEKKTIEIPEGYEARIEGNKVFLEPKESENERIIGRIKKAVESYWSDEPLDEILSWLEKQGGQKSAWSEEDEKFLKTALWHISYSVSNGKNTDEHCDTTDWLKSLKERYTWKPTDAQMESLDLLSRGEGSRHIILRSLYNSLQKLLN